jgi:hypothetical protein
MADVYRYGAVVPMSREVLEDAPTLTQIIYSELGRGLRIAQLNWEEELLNGHIGPKHRPGRTELWEARRPERRRDSIRRNVRGRPAGLWRRPTTGTSWRTSPAALSPKIE